MATATIDDQLNDLLDQGFDESYISGVGEGDHLAIHVGCSQCLAMCINGVAAHEHRCPNQRRRRTDDEDE